ncbi:MAG: hypothetical protein Q7S16_00955 [bacterium]|nr:hypothetical protein [bacterium]
MRKFLVVIFFGALFVFGSVVFAATSESEARPSFAEQKLGGDLFRFDDVVEISAPVTGDVYAVGREVVLRGPIDGDVVVLGDNITISGAVAGSVRVIGNTVHMQGAVGKNISIAARELTLDPEVRIAKNLSFVGQFITLASTIRGATQIVLVSPAEIKIQKSAVIDGPVTLYASEAPIVDSGALLHTPIERHDALWSAATTGDVIFNRIISFFSLLLIGLVFVHLLPRPSLVIASIMNTKPWNQFLWGLGFLILPPLVAILLGFTVIGLPLAIMIGALWAIVVYSARVFVGLTIGFMVLSHVDRKRKIQSLVVVLLMGTMLLAIGESLPIVGPIVTICATLWGLGGIMTLLRTLSIHQQKPA